MEKTQYRHPENLATSLMRNDYLNEYNSFFRLLDDKSGEQKKPIGPKGFSQRYPNMVYSNLPFEVTEAEGLKIKELDALSIEANRLIKEPTMNVRALLAIAIQVAEICNRPDWADQLRERIKE